MVVYGRGKVGKVRAVGFEDAEEGVRGGGQLRDAACHVLKVQ